MRRTSQFLLPTLRNMLFCIVEYQQGHDAVSIGQLRAGPWVLWHAAGALSCDTPNEAIRCLLAAHMCVFGCGKPNMSVYAHRQ